LKDESKRRDYDLIYPSIKQNSASRPTTETPRPPPTSTPKPEPLSEEAQIAALKKSKQERSERWKPKKNHFDSLIIGIKRDIQRLQQEIRNLDNIIAAEAAEEAQKKSWGTWFLSPISKQPVDSEEEKARKDRIRQERKLEKDMKERRLEWKKEDLSKEESRLQNAQAKVDAADMVDNEKIQVIRDNIWFRETREREERERVEREKRAREWKKQQEQQERREKRAREAAEALRKKQAEERAAEQKRAWEAEEERRKKQAAERAAEHKREVERARRRQKIIDDNAEKARQRRASCRHGGWWPKVEGRTNCPECSESWTYLLQCPGCDMKACPKCQYGIRHSYRTPHNGTRTSRSQNYSYNNDDDYDDHEYTSYEYNSYE
jgi:hypothetical protein